MSKKVLLVGHCGPDSNYLRINIRAAAPGAQVILADDTAELSKSLSSPIDLILLNRELGFGFEDPSGVAMIRQLKLQNPALRLMLVSNYPEAQADAVAAGALPGFGKRELGSPRVVNLLKEAMK